MKSSLFEDMRILKRKNDRLNQWLAQSDQQIELMYKENAALRRHAEEVTRGLLELRTATTDALTVVRERVASDAARLRGRELENESLRRRVAFLEKVLNSQPGTMYFGSEGFFLRGEDRKDE